MNTPANALFGPIKADAAGNLYVSPDGGLTWTAFTPGSGEAIPLSSLAPQAADTFVANGTGASASPTAITAAAAAALFPLATPSAAGLMSAAQANALAGTQAANVPGAQLVAYSSVIDLTAAPATYVIVPPIAARFFLSFLVWEIKTTTTATVSPTYSVGTNSASFNNIAASQTTAALHTSGAETQVSPTTAFPSVPGDLTANGLVLNITGAGTAAVLTARLLVFYGLAPV